jgi:hypothetical protein
MRTTKKIEWSYPTSPNAKHFGFYKTGCYTVETVDEHGSISQGGYATIQEAQKHADALPYDWNKFTRNIETESKPEV